jgi:ABC-type Fe3+-hydroxamate transport system substrate-binding protein
MGAEAATLRQVRCPILGRTLELPERPRRIVSLLSGLTEGLYALGAGARVAGVTKYCSRYVSGLTAPVVGDYLRVDEELLRRLNPDLVLATDGVQLGVARRLADAGFPVYVLPLPNSFGGLLDNLRLTGALLGDAMRPALELTRRMEQAAAELRAAPPLCRPRVYVELWFGRHLRTIGGLTFIHDLVEMAGGAPLFAGQAQAYFKPDFAAVAAAQPEVVLIFSEEDDHPVDARRLCAERGWTGAWNFQLIEAGIRRGQNMIHDGPSLIETAHWLHGRLTDKC